MRISREEVHSFFLSKTCAYHKYDKYNKKNYGQFFVSSPRLRFKRKLSIKNQVNQWNIGIMHVSV